LGAKHSDVLGLGRVQSHERVGRKNDQRIRTTSGGEAV